ncbi:MAG: ExbD/TolR family protein [Solitalea-like symbiont of Acarus siro]
MKLRNKKNKKAELGAFALNDILFFLLLFFLLSSTLVTQNLIKVNIPESKSTNTAPKKKIIVTLDKDGTIYLNNKLTYTSNLEKAFKAYATNKQYSSVIIYADKASTIKNLVPILDLANIYHLKTSLATKAD